MSNFFKSCFSILVLICLSMTINARVSSDSQITRHRNGVYMSVGGGATYISFEYERLFEIDKFIFFSAGAGLGSATEPYEANYTTMPFHVSGNVGKRASFFEFGFGRTNIFNHPDRNAFSYLILGYRLSLPKKHKLAFAFRLNLNIPFNYYNVADQPGPQFIPLGLGLGFAF